MEAGVGESDFVLIICSERCKTNANQRQGGSGYEARLMANEIFKNNSNKKFIPIILHEEDKKHIPNFLEGKVWIDLHHEKDSEEYNLRLNDLFASLISMTRRPVVQKRSVIEKVRK